jgi:hypothetical protein
VGERDGMELEESRLSTTALARKLNIPAQQLFATLRDYGWIERAGESWLLTPKGEYEGGNYQQSRRYGRYIVWPEGLVHHPLLAAIESNQRINAASMRRYYPRLHARQINRALRRWACSATASLAGSSPNGAGPWEDCRRRVITVAPFM